MATFWAGLGQAAALSAVEAPKPVATKAIMAAPMPTPKSTIMPTQMPTLQPTAEATAAPTAEASPAASSVASPQATAEPSATPSSASSSAKAKAVADKNDDEAKPAYKYKSPGVAVGLAFFPGVLVHGTGHIYAGAWMKGTGLLAVEGAAIGLGYQSVVNALSELDRIKKIQDSNPAGAVSADYGPLMAQAGVALVCTTAFLWSWIDDMTGSAAAAKQYNNVHSESDTTLQLRPEGGVQVAWRTNF